MTMTSKKLDALRGTATAPKVEPKVLPDLTNPPVDNLPKDRAPLSAQSHEAFAAHLAAMAVAPGMPDTIETTEAANAWYAGLSKQQQAAYQLEQTIEADLDKADTVSTIPLRWYFRLVDVYTDDKGECQLDAFPVPDSDSGNNPAIKKEPGRNKAGKPATVAVDFYDVLARSLTEGKLLRRNIESLQAAAPKSKADRTLILPEHKMLTDDQRQSRLNTFNQRWTRFRGALKDAIWIRITWAAIKALPLVEIDYVYDVTYNDDGTEKSKTITDTSTPFAIWAKGNDSLKFTYTVSNFVKLDPQWAAKNGGTLKALREGPPATPETPTSKIGVVTTNTVEPVFSELAAFLKDDKNAAALLTKAVANIGTQEAFSDDYVLSLGAVILGLDPIWKHIKDRYTALKIGEKKAADQVVRQQVENVGA